MKCSRHASAYSCIPRSGKMKRKGKEIENQTFSTENKKFFEHDKHLLNFALESVV